MSSVQDLLGKINSIKQDKIKTLILSTGEKIELDPLNLKQQKSIISASVNGVKGAISYPRILNEIILGSSCKEDLSLLDKPIITLALRINSIGDIYNNVNLKNLLKDLESVKVTFKKEDTLKYKELTVDVKIPTLEEENKVIRKLETLIKEDNDTQNLELAYSYEILKYVSRVCVDGISIEFNSINIGDRANILDKLPLSITKDIVKFIENYREVEKEWLTVDGVTIDLSPELFDIE